MRIKKWFKNQMAAAAIAISSVEKNVFNQQGTNLGLDTKQEQKHEEGTLAYNLKQGEVTQEVKDLRWRMYKVLKASENLKLKVHSMDQDGDFHFNSVKTTSDSVLLNKVKLDTYDDYELEMVVDNSEIVMDVADAMDNAHLSLYGDVKKYVDKDGDEIAIHGQINSNEFSATIKSQRPIKIERISHPKFYLENFTTKLNIRKINNEDKLLEFYVSKYPEELKPTSRLFVRKMEKALQSGLIGEEVFMMDEVGFITRNTLGSPDFLCYGYKITDFHKIVEFDGHYVIKFKGKVIVNGTDVLSDFIEEDLDKRYENKEVKKQKI